MSLTINQTLVGCNIANKIRDFWNLFGSNYISVFWKLSFV